VMNTFPNYLESYCYHVPMVYIRFGKWKEILDLELPDDPKTWPALTAVMYYARGIAYASLNMVEEAEAEKKKFLSALERKELAGRCGLNNLIFDPSPMKKGNLNVGKELLAGEILYRKKEFDKAFEHLRAAVILDDALVYDEPWGWNQPARHALGALLAEQGHFTEAKTVFEADLKKYPENLWSLRGLLTCAKANEKEEEVESIQERCAKASARATVRIDAPCFCANMNSQGEEMKECCKTTT